AVHAPEDAFPNLHDDRSFSGSYASAAWLDCSSRPHRVGGSGSLRDTLPLAVPAFSRDRLAVSRGLSSRGNPNAARGRRGWTLDCARSSCLLDDARSSEPISRLSTYGDRRLRDWRTSFQFGIPGLLSPIRARSFRTPSR